VGVAFFARYGNKYGTVLFGLNSTLLKSQQFSTSTGQIKELLFMNRHKIYPQGVAHHPGFNRLELLEYLLQTVYPFSSSRIANPYCILEDRCSRTLEAGEADKRANLDITTSR
jgi:hypothetical protein